MRATIRKTIKSENSFGFFASCSMSKLQHDCSQLCSSKPICKSNLFTSISLYKINNYPMDTNFVSIRELEQLAARKLDSNAYQYYRSGANQEITKRDNSWAFTQIKLSPRVLRDVSKICTKTKILGHEIDFPLGIAPTAMFKLAHPLGETIPAAAAKSFKIPYTLSTLSTSSITEVTVANGDGLRFFQLYIQKNRKLTESLVKLAEQEGFKALVVTVDAPVLGKREADEKSKFILPPHLELKVLNEIAAKAGVSLGSVGSSEGSGLLKFFANQIDCSLTWEDLKWLKSLTSLPIVLKGIQCKEDALLAKQYGVAAIWLSNHGGRQLDTVRATIEILPEVIEAVGKDFEVYIDGGVRAGTDIYKCLAIGARCVFIGRPVLYSVAINGQAGVERMLNILKSEFVQCMQLMGSVTIRDIKPDGLVATNRSRL